MINYFTREEKLLWILSELAIIFSFAWGGADKVTLIASLMGITSILFDAKGNPFGQILMVIFSLIYGVISYSYAYYGEMITYLGMTMPMAVLAFLAWMRHPYKGDRSEVEVGAMSKGEYGTIAVCFVAFLANDLYAYYCWRRMGERQRREILE